MVRDLLTKPIELQRQKSGAILTKLTEIICMIASKSSKVTKTSILKQLWNSSTAATKTMIRRIFLTKQLRKSQTKISSSLSSKIP